jgi:hypothetical protein
MGEGSKGGTFLERFPLSLGLLDGDLHTCDRHADTTPGVFGLVVGGQRGLYRLGHVNRDGVTQSHQLQWCDQAYHVISTWLAPSSSASVAPQVTP